MRPNQFGVAGSIWRAIWVALRRAPHDPNARRNLFRIIVSLLPFLVLIGFYAYFIHGALTDPNGDGNGLVMVVSGGFGLLLTALIAYRQRKEDRSFERENPAISNELKVAIFRETYLLATLLERLGSEIGMEKELPPTITVITRRVLLDRLAQLGLRETLEPWLVDILLAPDGHGRPT